MSNNFIAGWILPSLIIVMLGGCSINEKPVPDPWIKPWQRSWQEAEDINSKAVQELKLRCRTEKLRSGTMISVGCV